TDFVDSCSPPPGYVPVGGDCNDAVATVNPGASEVCNGVDDNCINGIDEGVQNTYFADSDNDGFGNGASTTLACSVPPGYVTNADDCDDTRNNVNPATAEVCDGLDNNCVNGIDEGVQSTWYRDFDADNYGSPTNTTLACTAPPGFVGDNTDCNDMLAVVNPGAAEICDGLDNNCINGVDEGVELTFYRDADNDSYGNAVN